MQLHIFAAGSTFVLPSFGQSQHGTIALSSLNRAANHAIQLAQKQGLPLGDFTIHDMRRTASTHLHEAGYNSDWIEKLLPTNRAAFGRFTTRQNTQNNAGRCCRIGRIWLMGGLGVCKLK